MSAQELSSVSAQELSSVSLSRGLAIGHRDFAATGNASREKVALNERVLELVRVRFADASIDPEPAFLILEFTPEGLVATVVEAGTGMCVMRRSDTSLSDAAIDKALAQRLVHLRRVSLSDPDGDMAELADMMGEVRNRLAHSEAVFMMGQRNVGLVRICRTDISDALAPLVPRARSDWHEAALISPLAVTAVVLMPEHTRWRGVAEGMAEGSVIPILALEHMQHKPSRNGRHSRDAEPAPVGPPSRPANDHNPEALTINDIDRAIRCGAAVPNAAIAGRTTVGDGAVSPTPDRHLGSSARTLFVRFGGSRSSVAQRKSLHIAAVSTLIGSLIIGVLLVVVPWISTNQSTVPAARHESSGDDGAPRTPADSAPRTSPSVAASSSPSVNVNAAERAPLYYTPPRVTPRSGPPSQLPVRPQSRPVSPTPRPRPAPRPRLVLPNPIPGAPPIVVP